MSGCEHVKSIPLLIEMLRVASGHASVASGGASGRAVPRIVGGGCGGAVETPVDVIDALGGAVLLEQVLSDLARVVELRQIVCEHGHLAEIVEERIALAQLVILLADALEKIADGGVAPTG